jgi:hypothetical protein
MCIGSTKPGRTGQMGIWRLDIGRDEQHSHPVGELGVILGLSEKLRKRQILAHWRSSLVVSLRAEV